MVTKKKIIKRLTTLIFAAALALTGTVPSFAEGQTFEGAPDGPEINAEAAVIMDAGSGQLLYDKDAYDVRDPASMTKVLNLLVCLDTLDFNEVVTVDRFPEPTPSTMHLHEGETIKVEDLVYCMMMWSSNDAAEYLGYLAGGDMETFCKMMNDKAAGFGAKDTKYKNPNGLNPDPVNNLTTPYDTAIIMTEAMRDERFREIVGTTKHTVPETNKYKQRNLTSTNKCLWDQEKIDELAALEQEAAANPPVYIVDELTGEKKLDAASAARNKKINKLKKKTRYMVEGCIGGKTGYTSTAGGCYTGYASRGNMDVVIVLMGAVDKPTRFKDAVKLWDYAYENFQCYTAATAGDVQESVKVKRGTLRKVDVGIRHDLKVSALKDADPSKTVTTELVLPEEKLMAPIKKGTVIGEMIAYDNGKEVSRQDLITLEKVGKGGPLSYIGIADEDLPEFFLLVGLAIVTLIIIRMIIVTSRRKAERERKHADM